MKLIEDTPKNIKPNYSNIQNSIKVFEDIKKEVLTSTNINEFVLLVQWKYPLYSNKEIIGYLEYIGRVTPKVKNKSQTKRETILSKYTILRILHDIPVFVGHDRRKYKLNKYDVATIPLVNAKALIKRKVAVEINQAVVQ